MTLPEPLQPVFVNDPLPAALNEERDAINSLVPEIENRIPHPSGAAYGDLLRWNGISWETTETRFLEGEGRPDGKEAGPIGTRYIDKLGSQGAVEWVKRAGTADSNTGWICLAGDTEWRDISSLVNLRTSGVVHAARIRRINTMVDLYVDMTMPNNEASPYNILVLPTGFRTGITRHGLIQDNKEGAANSTAVEADGTVNLYNPVKTRRDRWNGTWTTSDAWPSALPGSAL